MDQYNPVQTAFQIASSFYEEMYASAVGFGLLNHDFMYFNDLNAL